VAILSLQDQVPAGVFSPRQADCSAIPAGVLEQALASPPIYVHKGENTLQGSAHDPSGIASVTVQTLDPNGDTADTVCRVAAPLSGGWSCTINLPAAPNDTRYFARAQATNPFGYTSAWSPWRALVIDSLAPTVTLDPASQTTLSSAVLGPGTLTVSGQIQDNDLVKRVDICLKPDDSTPAASPRCRAIELNDNNGQTGDWSLPLVVPAGMDYTSRTLLFFGWDAAGNRSDPPLEQTVWFDTLAPRVAVATQLSLIALNDYLLNPVPILTGTASDGSGVVDIVVRLTAPGLGTQRSVVPVSNNKWSYIPEIKVVGVYSLSLEARDLAGNLTTLGSWTLVVSTDAFKIWMPRINK